MKQNSQIHTPETEASARRWTYRGVISLALFGGLAIVAWQWRSGVTVISVEVRDSCDLGWFESTPGCDALMADSAKIAGLVGVQAGALLYEVDTREVVERVSRHPWVASARVHRTPGGKLIVEASPRKARLLAMRHGHPVFFVDAAGNAMPFTKGLAYDVPLLHGLESDYEGPTSVKDPRVRILAETMADLDADVDALISEVELRRGGDAIVHTTPASNGPTSASIEARIDFEDLPDQLLALRAYWDQVLLTSASTGVREIDLRFNNQIVTR